MKLFTVTPIWRRPGLTRRYLNHLERWKAHARRKIGFSAVIVGSEGKASRYLVDGRPFYYVEHSNEWLGAKFNAGIRRAVSLGADYVLIMGSDQFADVSMLDRYIELMKRGVPYAGVLDTYAYDVEKSEAVYWGGYKGERAGSVVGPGRLIRRDILEALDCEVYDPALNLNLDGSADLRLPEPETFISKPFRFVSVKTVESLTPYVKYEGEAVSVDLFKDLLR